MSHSGVSTISYTSLTPQVLVPDTQVLHDEDYRQILSSVPSRLRPHVDPLPANSGDRFESTMDSSQSLGRLYEGQDYGTSWEGGTDKFDYRYGIDGFDDVEDGDSLAHSTDVLSHPLHVSDEHSSFGPPTRCGWRRLGPRLQSLLYGLTRQRDGASSDVHCAIYPSAALASSLQVADFGNHPLRSNRYLPPQYPYHPHLRPCCHPVAIRPGRD